MSNTSIYASAAVIERKFGLGLVLQYIVWDNLVLEWLFFICRVVSCSRNPKEAVRCLNN